MIELIGVKVLIQNTIIFSDLSLNFEDGVSYLIDGRNGTGKTTLLKLLYGKVTPRSGKVVYDFIPDSLNWDQKFELRKKFIHYIPVNAIHDLVNPPDLFYQQRYYSVEDENLPTVRSYLGSGIERISDLELPTSFRIDNLLDLELTRLSNGQVKKVIILKQLFDSIPKVLLLDYPFEGLDALSRSDLKEFLDHLATVFNVSLIVTDQDHEYIPEVIKKKITITYGEASVQSRAKSKGSIAGGHKRKLELSSEDPVVEMHKLTIRYGSKIIIKDLDWIIKKGERWALTGRNGSGKTTLFSLIFADHPMAYSEKVYLFGKRRGTGESIWDIKKRISYLGPEQIHFLDHQTSLQMVSRFLGERNPRVSELVEYFEIELLLQKRLSQLSSGQLQLVFLISMFLSKKELLLLDEPFQFLDYAQKERVAKFLDHSLDKDTTLILITHYEEDVAQWTNHRLRL